MAFIASFKGGKYKQCNAYHLCSENFSADHVTVCSNHCNRKFAVVYNT